MGDERDMKFCDNMLYKELIGVYVYCHRISTMRKAASENN
jgi:hypothetical protein